MFSDTKIQSFFNDTRMENSMFIWNRTIHAIWNFHRLQGNLGGKIWKVVFEQHRNKFKNNVLSFKQFFIVFESFFQDRGKNFNSFVFIFIVFLRKVETKGNNVSEK